MDAALFLEQFGPLADSSGGVGKLRSLILELAVRGQLVPQNPDDEPASELLKRIDAEKQRRIKAGELKAPAPLPPIREDEIPYPVPDGWAWSRLAVIGEINPRNSLDDHLPVSFVPMTLISEHYGIGPETEIRSWGEIRKGYTHFADGDVALAKITPCFQNGKACVMRNLLNGFGAGTTELHIFRDVTRQLFVDYVYVFLKSPSFVQNGIALMTGTAGQQRVPKDYFAFTPFPLPPLAEQERIVAKVDELMALCDQLEAQQTERNHLREHAAKSTLFHLTDAPTRSEARPYWHYAEQHFPHLFDRSATVADLRATILQLAVQGRLVPQNPDDEPASELLKRIDAEKKRLIKAGELRASAPLPPIREDEIPYPVPDGWAWVRLGGIMKKMGAGSTPSGGSKVYVDDGVPFLRSQNVWNDGLRLNDVARITPETHEKMSGTHVVAWDVLLNITGASIGRCAISPANLTEANVSQHVAILRLFDVSIAPYLHICVVSPVFQQTIMDVQVGVSREGLSMTRLKLFPFAVPPLAEQERIVAKVDALMALCDQLEAEADTRQARAGRLFDSIVYHLFAAEEVTS